MPSAFRTAPHRLKVARSRRQLAWLALDRLRPLAASALLALALPVAAQAPAAGGTALSYAQAAQRLLQVSDALSAAEAGVDSKRNLAAATRDLRLPDIALDVRELKYQKSLEIPLGALGSALAPFGVPDSIDFTQGGWRFRPTVSATMPLYTGGQIPAAQQAAAAALRQAEAERRGESQNQTLLLIQAYFGQQLADRAVAIRRETRDGLQRHLEDAEKLEQAGMATRAQRLQATVARDQAERDYRRALADRDTLGATLAQLLRVDGEVATTTPLFVSSRPPAALQTYRQAARERHPQMARLEAMVDQAQQAVVAQQSSLKPQIFLFGQRDLKRSDALLTEPDWIFGIGLRYTLFSASDRPHRIGAARSTLTQAEAGLREAATQVEIGATRAWNALETARQQFLLLDSAVEQAQENLRLQDLSFREGLATSLDVIDARLRLGAVHVERAQAAYQYDVALAHLLEVTGQLDRYAEHIGQADKVIEP